MKRVCFFIALFCSSFIFCQKSTKTIEYGLPQTRVFSSSEYGGEAQNLDFIQDEKGQLIVANTYGFLIYDGVSWKKFKPDNEGLPISYAKSNSHRVYTGGTEFIGYLEPSEKGDYKYVDLTKELPENVKLGFIWHTLFNNGTVYFENTNNVIIYKENKFKVLSDGSKVGNIFEFENVPYVSTKKGLYKIINDELIRVPEFDKIKDARIKNLYRLSKDSIQIITGFEGIFLWNNKNIKPVNSELSKFLEKNWVMKFGKLSDGNLAIATSKGGLIITDRHLNLRHRITRKTGLPHDNVRAFYQDVNQNLWIACQSGIAKMNYPIHTTFYEHNPENIGIVEEITKFKDDIYIGTGTGTFVLNKVSSSDILSENHYAKFSKVKDSDIFNFANFVLGDKLYYSGTSGTNVYDGKTSKIVNSKEAREFYKSKFHKNVLFMGHKLGFEILIYDDNFNIVSSKSVEEVPYQIRGIAEDKYKNLWLTTISNGVYKVNLDEELNIKFIEHYVNKDGLPSLRDILVYNVKDDIIFTTQRGFYKFNYDKNLFEPSDYFGEEYKGGVDDFIYSFNFDSNDNGWIHSFRKKVSAVAEKTASGEYIINKEKFTEINNRAIYEILSEPDKERVWFGGADGLVNLSMHTVDDVKKTLKPIISKITVNDSILVNGPFFSPESQTSLDQTYKDFKFEVGSSHFQNIKENKFQYFLEGYDKDWSEWTSEPFKIYTNLDHNNYTFSVRTKNVYGSISEAKSFSFDILPKWYQKVWAQFLFLIGFISLIVLITRYMSERKFIKKTHELEIKQQYENEKNEAIIKEQQKSMQAIIQAEENERTRIARELHDGVVQQIGSVILKSRNVLENLKAIEKPESKELLKNLEESNQDLRNISHQMMPRALNELGIIPALEDLLKGSLGLTEVQYNFEHFNISERLTQKVEVTIYRVVQELINNIIKHSKASEVSVQLFKTGNDIILIIEDNGVGMPVENQKRGIGLLNISSRLDMVNGYVNFEPSPQSGTLVTIKIPT